MSLNHLSSLIQTPNLASKKWVYEQYDSQVMNDTLQTGGDASLVRVHGTNKALAMSVDCTPRYVEADPFEGAKQAVAETYRNICAVGATPLAITNCLNFGNPQKPEIMGQIVRAIKGITEASKVLDYPVISGNVSLYNETDGRAIQPTPAIGGVGLLKDLSKRCNTKLKKIGDEIFMIGEARGHLNCSLFEAEIQKIDSKKNPPAVDLAQEKKHGEFVRGLIATSCINACHDISDGGMLTCLFEMCGKEIGAELDITELKALAKISDEQIFFGEEQGRYLVSLDASKVAEFLELAKKEQIFVAKIGKTIAKKIKIAAEEIAVESLIAVNQALFEKKFS
jgi:phosphoribosylformylglycinamidine (FGAM) synthase-like enzyme